MTSHRSLVIWRRLAFRLPLEAGTAVDLLQRLVVDASLGHIILETRAQGGRAEWLLASTVGQRLDAAIKQLTPDTRVTTPRTSRRPVDQALRLSVSRASLPLSTDRLEAVARAVLAALSTTESDEELVIQLHIGPRYHPALVTQDRPQGWLELLGLRTPPSNSEAVQRSRAQAARHRAGVSVRLGVRAANPQRRRALLQSLLGALRVAESAGVRLRAHAENPAKLSQARRPWRYPLILPAREIACLNGWPIGQEDMPATPHAHPRHLPLPKARDDQRVFAFGLDDQHDQRLGVSIADALYHTVLLGPTGAGKSTAMANLALADIRAGRGVLLIDPKQDLVSDLLARIPDERHGDVVVLDPTSPTPVGLNPLASDGDRRHCAPEVVADTVLATFKALFAEAWGVRSEEILTAALLTLARTPGSTLVDLPLLLTNPVVRRRLVSAAPDPLGTDQFWAKYGSLTDAQRLQWIAPVLNKLQPFLIRPHLRATLGQATPRFHLSDLFTKRRIVLVSLNKGVLGTESARLLGSLIVGQLWPLILERASLPPRQRHITSVYIDEVQDYLALPGDLSDALAQARSLGIAFHLAHQYRAQLPPSLKAAVDTNARNKIIFGLSATDAAEVAKQAPGLESLDFQLLPRFHVCAHALYQGQPQPWTLARTLPLPPARDNAAEIKAASNRRYGQNADDVETQLLQRLGLNGMGTVPATPAIDSHTAHSATTSPTTGTAPPATTTPGPVTIGRRPGRSSAGRTGSRPPMTKTSRATNR